MGKPQSFQKGNASLEKVRKRKRKRKLKMTRKPRRTRKTKRTRRTKRTTKTKRTREKTRRTLQGTPVVVAAVVVDPNERQRQMQTRAMGSVSVVQCSSALL